jgi:hypothetical protein
LLLYQYIRKFAIRLLSFNPLDKYILPLNIYIQNTLDILTRGNHYMCALFSKKGGKKVGEIDFRIMRREERETFFEFLGKLGWVQIDQPFEFDEKWSHAKIRKAAKDSAAQMDADLLVETEDEAYSSSPFNNFVYYVWRRSGDSLPLPPGFTVPPFPLMQQLVMHREMQKRMKQMPQAPPGQPPMQQPGMSPQQAPPSQQPPQQPRPPQQAPPGQQPAPQQPRPPQQAQPGQQPAPQQPRPPAPAGAPPQQAAPPKCPKCGGPVNVLPNGAKQCPKCGPVQ